MRVVHVRRYALAGAAALVLSALLPQTLAHAATPKATVYPLTSPITGLSSAGQMVEAKGDLYVSSPAASDVKVLSTTGTVLTNLSGLAGADGLVVSSDGKDVFVALSGSNRIGVIDTTSRQEVSSFPVDSCPTSLAIASGRLFYSFGCPDDSAGIAGVSSIDLANPGATPVVAVAGLTTAGLVRTRGNVLAVFDGNQTVSTYTATDDGSVVPATNAPSATVANVEDMTITSDTKNLLVATSSPYQITSYATATMATNSVTYRGVAYPEAVAADPQGKYVAAGFQSAATTAELYAQGTGAPLWARYTAGANPTTWVSGRSDDAVYPQTMIFSTAGTSVFALVRRAGRQGRLPVRQHHRADRVGDHRQGALGRVR